MPVIRVRSRLPLSILGSVIALALLSLSGVPSVAADPGQDPPDVHHYSFFEGWGTTPYPLDPVPRFLERGQRVTCDRDSIVRYRSEPLRYTAHVNEAFAPRLRLFDELVARLAREHYGREPRRLVHRGAFVCRSARNRRGRISEHAFGNALDFRGLDFRWMPRSEEAPEAMPRHMRRGFRLRVLSHWSPRRSRDRYHAEFLHRLAEELRGRPDIFRGIVGPPRPRHRDHLHLDVAPWRYAMFGYDRPDD